MWAIPDHLGTEDALADAVQQIRKIGLHRGIQFDGLGTLSFHDDLPIVGPDGDIWDGPVLVASCAVLTPPI